MKKIFLLDTMSFIYRAYHAAAHQSIMMSTKAGFPTGASYIFCNMLRKLQKDFNPEYLIAICDTPGETFRDKLSPDYKANRKGETPYDLVRQLPHIFKAIEAYGISKMELAGYEADDIIGTLARKIYAEDPENQVYIVTGDKDMFQLVNDRTFTINPMKDLVCDVEKVTEIVGVPPEQVVDVMALRGDTTDNVPGAPGIGKKGSVDIIKQFGSLEQAFVRTDELKRKSYKESLKNNQAQILLSKQLVTIEINAPVELSISSMKIGETNTEALSSLYKELEFATLLKREGLGALPEIVDDFAEIVPPDDILTQTTMTKEDADDLIDSIS
jgi:DNA polymerase-1